MMFFLWIRDAGWIGCCIGMILDNEWVGYLILLIPAATPDPDLKSGVNGLAFAMPCNELPWALWQKGAAEK